MSAVTTTTEIPHVFVHPRDRSILGVKLRDVKHDVDRELLRSLASEKSTAPVWPIFQAVGASDAQIDGVLRLPGPRAKLPGKGSDRPAVHWHWRTTFRDRGETQFWLRSKLQLSGPELVACVRRLLSIPALEPGPAPAEPGDPAQPPGMTEAEYAEMARGAMEVFPEPCRHCGGAGELEWECDRCEGSGRECSAGVACHECGGHPSRTYPCEQCRPWGSMDIEAEPDPEPVAPAHLAALGAWWVAGTIADGDDATIEAGAEILAEGLADRAAAENWLREHHAEMAAAHGYDCYCVDGCTADAAWDAAECWQYDEAGALASERDGRML